MIKIKKLLYVPVLICEDVEEITMAIKNGLDLFLGGEKISSPRSSRPVYLKAKCPDVSHIHPICFFSW